MTYHTYKVDIFLRGTSQKLGSLRGRYNNHSSAEKVLWVAFLDNSGESETNMNKYEFQWEIVK